MIKRARRRTKTRFRVTRRRAGTCLNSLSAEILFLIADFLEVEDVATLQKAMKFYLGDGYWRSRMCRAVPGFVGLYGEPLDWQFLCLELERKDSEWHKVWKARQWVLGQVDEIAVFYKSH